MELVGDILRIILGMPFIAAIALLVTWAALQVGMHAVALATGRVDPKAPARQWWEKNEIIALMAIITPIPDLFLKDASFVQLIASNPFVGVTSISIVAGIALGLTGTRRTNWAISAATAVVAIGLWLLLLTMPFRWTNETLVVIYAIAAAVTCYFYVKAFQLAVGAKDELVTDFSDPDLTDRIRHGAEVLASDGEVLSEQPRVKTTTLVPGFLHKHLDFTALADPKGLHLRIPAPGADVLEIDPGYPVTRRAVWFLIPWDNLEVIKFDRIIGHTEIRLRLRHSGHEIVLEQPPKKIKQYLAKLNKADGGQPSAATA